MKNKSARHKSENTFKFIPFAERINNIDVDIFHKVAHEYETQLEEDECIFHQTIDKWNVLNLTQYYDDFKKDIFEYKVISLPQLIYNKDNVKEVLIKHLKLKNELGLQPLLDLVVALAKDLRQDFYPYFQEFFQVILELLKTNNSDQLEWTFHCLAYLFKFLWRPIVADIGIVFKTLLPLLSSHYPGYVNNFAAESFAFVARKVKDFKSFLLLILKNVKHQDDGVDGCGRLLYEVVKGITGQFHSCANNILPILINTLHDDGALQSVLFEVLEKVIEHITENINPGHGELLFQTIIASVNKQKKISLDNQESDHNIKTLNLLLTLLGQALEYRGGRFVQKSSASVAETIVELIKTEKLPTDVVLTSVKISIILLLSKHIHLTQAEASNIVLKVLHWKDEQILLYFVEHTFDYALFSTAILPRFLSYCVETKLNEECFHLLTKLIMNKSPLCLDSVELINWRRFLIDFAKFNEEMKNILIDHSNDVQNFENLDHYVSSLVILPHLKDISKSEETKLLLSEKVKMLCNKVSTTSKETEGVLEKNLFALITTLESYIHLHNESQSDGHDLQTVIVDALLPYSTNPKYVWALHALDLYFTFQHLKKVDNIFNKELLLRLHETLKVNFNSPYHKLRLFTSRIFSYFDHVVSETTENACNVFSLCYEVESINSQVDTYRDQILRLEKLNYEKSQIQIIKNTEFADVPLRYLCGVLYMNFKLLWNPVLEIIATLANGMEIDEFWKIFVIELRVSSERVRQPPVITYDLMECKFSLIGDLYQRSCRNEDKPDFLNYRLHLWKSMIGFAHVAEARNRDLVDLFLSFINEEYMKTNSEIAFVANIKQANAEVAADIEMEEETVENGEQSENADAREKKEIEIIKQKLKQPIAKQTGKSVLILLLHHFQVLAKMRSPKSMYKEKELYKLYFEFLAHKNAEVQKAVLDCLMTYKNKNVTPYSTHLYNLVDDKKLKSEIVQFKLDEESEHIQPTHRKDLMPFVLKIAYSKMMIRTGGKAGGQQRRGMIFRFLGGCNNDEMLLFIKMAFKFFEKYLSNDVEISEITNSIIETTDLENFVPPKRLQSTENMLQVVFEQFGNLMNEQILNFILKVLLCIGATLKGATLKQSEIHAGYFSILRSLRTTAIKLLEQFFSRFEYPWNVKEINAVFDIFISPSIVKLEIEGIHSPTNLMKLLAYWASNPRYYMFLVKSIDERTPLEHLINLLLNPKSHGSVTNSIMEMLENMLKLTLDDGEMMIDVEGVKLLEDSVLARLKVPKNNLNYGSCILLPHVPKILRQMKDKLLKRKKIITRRDMTILSRISELVWESDISDATLELLIPILVKKAKTNAKEEDIMQLLITVKNLLLNVEDVVKHVRNLSPLFGFVKESNCRKVLCEIFTHISTKSPDYVLVNELLLELNAMNARWIDQPDYDRRLTAYRKIETLCNEDKLSLEIVILLIYNSYHTIRVEKDLSMKESAIDCLRVITPWMIMKYHQTHRNYILDETVLPLIKSGFKSMAIRNDCIALLGLLARDCGDAHVVLRDLNKLTNKSDLEVDFFENLIHLQIHRHQRAFLKFKEVFSKEDTLPNIRTLIQYIIPLANFYLCNEEYSAKHSLVESAIDVLATSARLMPWHHYEPLLKNYLGKLMHNVEHQKQLVKIVVSLLDSYHFDLSKGLDQEGDPQTRKQEESAKIIDNKEEDIKQNEEDKTSDMEDNDDEDEDKISESEDEEEEPIENQEAAKIKPYDKITVLCKSAAKRIIKAIKTMLLPQLNRALAMTTTYENSHKVNRKKGTREQREDEDLVRIPITLAVVKLLQKLPKPILDRNLPGVIMKICTFLKVKLESVRRAARETLQKIILTLGPSYLKVVLGEMSGLQFKGFQMHVLLFTIHAILGCLKPHYEPGHIDEVLLTVLDMCILDLFGVLADEREVAKIATKTSEASSPKSYDTLQILATYITQKCVMDLLLPIKKVLGTTHSLKIVNKAEECLKHIALGLVDNEFIDVDVVIKFAYGTASQSIPDLLYKEKTALTPEQSEKLARQKPDSYIIPKAPTGRLGAKVCNMKSSRNANAHLLVAFGLRLCNLLLKRDKLKDMEYKSYLDPFVNVVKECINTPHMKVNTTSLQCLEWILKLDLPSLKESIKQIAKALFALLHKYAAAGLRKGDNFDLVVAAFKTMSVLVRDVKFHIVETDQLKLLLLYVEQDLYNHERQATAFGLLKAIIARKLVVPEIHDIIMKVGELSITSELTHVRHQCRIVFHHYLMDYPLGKKLETYVGFYIAQMSYELQSGRESALDMMQMLINSFPIHVIKNFSGTFFVTIGTRLINDEVPVCRKMAAKCITSMLERLDKSDRDPLFDIVISWFQDRKILHRTLAAHMCGLLINVEKDTFDTRISILVPKILKQFNRENADAPGKFVRVQDETDNFTKERTRDHHLYQVLQMILKLCSQCPSFFNHSIDVENISIRTQALLAYPHDWVRLAAAQVLGYVLNSIDIQKLSQLVVSKSKLEVGYLYSDPNNSLKSLTLDLCAQLQPDATKTDLAEQVIKNLILIARVLQRVPINKRQTQDDDADDNNEDDSKRVNLLWLVKRARRIINIEIVENAQTPTLRIALFKFIAALVTIMEVDVLKPIMHHLLAPLVREMVTKEKSTDELLQLSKEVSMLIKNKIGKAEYAKLLSNLESQLTVKRAERKRERVQLAVTDPELYAKKKIKHNEKKKELKKKNIQRMKGMFGAKRKKPVDIDVQDD